MKIITDLIDELKTVLTGRLPLVDYLLPSLFYLVVSWMLGVQPAIISSAVGGLGIFVFRLKKRQNFWPALVGMVIGLLIAGWSSLKNIPELVIYQDIFVSVIIILALFISVIIKKPLVAVTSFLVRRWSWSWYFHPRVRPAYSEVTLFWVVFSVIKLYIQTQLLNDSISAFDLLVRVLLGWPAMIALLIFSYLYGIKRLQALKGPSVEEFLAKKKSPWQGQQKGF